MTPHIQKLREEIFAFEPALMESAIRLTKDENEAHHLVHLTMMEAFSLGEARVHGDCVDTRVWLFGLLRGVFHSIARRRSARQERGHYAAQRQLDRADLPTMPA